jgi:hypothetical protein
MPKKPIILRPPNKPSPNSSWKPPQVDWLEGTWHVTHSTLPLWETKKNVRITYKSLPSEKDATSSNSHRLDDLVSYQWLNSDDVKTIHGIDTPSRDGDTGAWDWRGTGWLFLTTSHWEFLGWGDGSPEDEGLSGSSAGKQEDWAVTYFDKTLFTPVGIDIYSRSEGGLSPEMVSRIRAALREVDDVNVRRLEGEIFEITRESKSTR